MTFKIELLVASMLTATGCFTDAPAVPEGTEGTTGSATGSGSTSGSEPTPDSGSTASTGAPGTTAEGTTAEGTTAEGTTAEGTTAESTTAEGTTAEGTTGPMVACGNGEVEAGEECDGTDWRGATCESLGHVPGTLACRDDCSFDVSGCVPPQMVLVPGGGFEMGSSDQPDEQPVRMVTVDAFYIDETEVTVADYSACVNAGECFDPGTGGQCNFMVPGREDHPINCVGWSGASSYCGWVSGGVKRLPTEAEWEKAARSTDARTYPWGDAPEPSCVLVVMDDGGIGCGIGSTWPVGSRPAGASAQGALDLAGNVWEWVSDWYGPYDSAETDNPTGPLAGDYRIVRGGGWYHASAEDFTSTLRHEVDPGLADAYIGFRCVQNPPAAP